MPGRSPKEAFLGYADPLKDVLGCVTSETILRRKIPNLDNEQGALQELFFVRNPVILKSNRSEGRKIALYFSQHFRVLNKEETCRIETKAYSYEIEDARSKQELLAFHWQPEAPNSRVSFPHLHVGLAPKAEMKGHIPTGRVPVEDIVWFLISDLEVTPLKPDWETVLAASRQAFVTKQSW